MADEAGKVAQGTAVVWLGRGELLVPEEPSMGVRRVDDVHVRPHERARRGGHNGGSRRGRRCMGWGQSALAVVVLVLVIRTRKCLGQQEGQGEQVCRELHGGQRGRAEEGLQLLSELVGKTPASRRVIYGLH